MTEHYPPQVAHEEFSCPHCGVYAQQSWFLVVGRHGEWRPDTSTPPPNPYNPLPERYVSHYLSPDPAYRLEGGKPYGVVVDRKAKVIPQSGNDLILDGFYVSICMKCEEPTLWHDREMLYPALGGVEAPNPALNDDIKSDYYEAASVAAKSPRAAAALLRLCVQNLCKQLGLPAQNLNADIGELVKRGLNPDVQKALDALRVIGNNAVHPLEMDLRDDRETAVSLFSLINYIADQMITYRSKLESLFKSLPEGAKQQIKKRDAGT